MHGQRISHKVDIQSNFSRCTRAEMTIGDALSREEVSSRLTFSRKLASLVIDHNMCLCTQHINGIRNIVADILSRDFHLSEVMLTHLLFHFYPSHLPRSFGICPLPREITSFIIGTLEVLPE